MNNNTTPTANDAINRWFLVFFQALATVFLAGATLGWGPMQLVLETNKTYSDKCTPEERQEGIVCDNQTSSLLTIGLLISGTQLLSPFLGYLLDCIGPKNLSMAMALCGMTGMVIGFVAVGWHVDPLLFVAFPLLGICSWIGSLLIIQLGFYFQGHTASRVIFGLNTLFDSGILTYWALWLIQDTTGTDPLNVWIGYMILAGFIYGGLVYFWRIAKIQPEQDFADKSPSTLNDDAPSKSDGTNAKIKRGATDAMDASETESTDFDHDVEYEGITESLPSSSYQMVADRGPYQQLTSPFFLLICFFFGIQCSANLWNIGTQRDFLAYLGDDDKDNLYLTIFTLLTPLSVLASPIIDYVILNFGWIGAFQTINTLGLLYTLTKVVSDDLNVQIIGFVFFSLYRGFLFGVTFSFLPHVVSGPVIGRAAGIMNMISGAAFFLTIPLARMAISNNDGDFLCPISCTPYSTAPVSWLLRAWACMSKRKRPPRKPRK